MGVSRKSSNDRLALTLAIPRLTSKLVIQLMKNIDKMKKYFDIETEDYNKIIKSLIGDEWYDKWKKDGWFNSWQLATCLDSKDMKHYSEELGIDISDDYYKVVREEWYRYYDRRDYYVLKYFCNRGFFREDLCEYCGQPGSREHYVDECEHFQEKKMVSLASVRKYCWREEFEGERLSKVLDALYFRPSTEKRVRSREQKIIRECMARIFWRGAE
jgi:hypothetical protein